MKTCKHCNSEIRENFNFCPMCGTSVEKVRKSTHQLDEEENPRNLEDVIE